MVSEAEPEPSSTPKLPLLTIPPRQSPDHSGMLTPPIHTSASVPFRWEEEPGKPRPCTSLITLSHHPNTTTTEPNKGLELPPRLQFLDSKMTKMPSPTTVLDGPDVGMPVFRSSSLRFRRESFGSSTCGSPERGQLGAMVFRESKERGLVFGSWGRKLNPKGGKKKFVGGSFDCSSSYIDFADFGGGGGGGGGDDDDSAKMSRIRRNGSFSGLSPVRSHFWATVYEGFKQVLPWKSRKSKKDRHGI